jgi:site-specific recombinase XerD
MLQSNGSQSSKMQPIFDTAEYLEFHPEFPAHMSEYQQYSRDYFGAHAYLYAYKENKATFNTYRREVERLLQWSWYVKKSIFTLRRADIEEYLNFCQNPPVTWIGLSKPPRFSDKDDLRIPNPQWRPFVATVSKSAAKNGAAPSTKNYVLSEKAIKEMFAILSSFFNFLIQEEYAEVNPITQVRQKSRFIRRQQSSKKIRRLSELQWNFVIETAEIMAEENKEHERTLFIMTALYAMYLRISELVISDRWTPQMNDFKCDYEGNWWFTTVGKGNKERQVAVSNSMFAALKRWRQHLGLPAIPSADDNSPLLPKTRGRGGFTSTNHVRNIVQACFDKAAARMSDDGFTEEAKNLAAATVHWLRHTGISDDVKRRPREHVRDDAGHSSSQTTDQYIDIDLHKRHESARDKPVRPD